MGMCIPLKTTDSICVWICNWCTSAICNALHQCFPNCYKGAESTVCEERGIGSNMIPWPRNLRCRKRGKATTWSPGLHCCKGQRGLFSNSPLPPLACGGGFQGALQKITIGSQFWFSVEKPEVASDHDLKIFRDLRRPAEAPAGLSAYPGGQHWQKRAGEKTLSPVAAQIWGLCCCLLSLPTP